MVKPIKPPIRPRKDWGALEPEPGMFRYPDIKQAYYRVTFHHGTDEPRTPRDVPKILRAEQLVHMSQGWRDLGYHYLIDPWGAIWAGRNLHYRGVHVADANTGNLGICFVMHGDRESLTKAAYDSAVALAAWWCHYLTIDPKQIKGHRDYLPTACPGGLVYPDITPLRNEVTKILRGAR